MLRKMFFGMLFFLLFPSMVMGFEIGGVTLPDSIPAGKQVLILNGAGIRKKFFFKIICCRVICKTKNFFCQ